MTGGVLLEIRSIVVPATLAAMLFLTSAIPGTAGEDAGLARKIREEDERRTVRWAGFYRVRAGYSQTLAGGVGLVRARLPGSWDCSTACPFRGPVLQIEPGLHGAQLGFGWATMMAETRHRRNFLPDVHLAFGVKAVLLRTWEGANVSPPDRTFAGVEYSFTVTGFNFSLGTLRRIDDPGGADWLVSGNLGWGF